jgi:putative ubiquitin-RnfH superfamily antitoxin RatB of RatAB toxin-antitoxin module
MDPADVRVTVVYCAPGCEDISEVTLPAGATVGDAIGVAGVLGRRPEIGTSSPDVGVWGRSCALTQRVEDGDRVEIYRPLTVDPKEARRVRVEVRRQRSGRP